MAITVKDLTAAERIGMVQEGYNPLNPDDLKRYRNRQSPIGEQTQLVGRFGQLGESRLNDQRDYGKVIEKGYMGGGEYDGEDYEEQPEKARKGNIMKEYSGYSQRSNRGDVPQTTKKGSLQLEGFETKNQQSKKITDPNKASSLGYDLSIDYLNAFTANLKQPHSNNRRVLLIALNKLYEMEKTISADCLKYFKSGVSKAEKQLYEQLKKR